MAEDADDNGSPNQQELPIRLRRSPRLNHGQEEVNNNRPVDRGTRSDAINDTAPARGANRGRRAPGAPSGGRSGGRGAAAGRGAGDGGRGRGQQGGITRETRTTTCKRAGSGPRFSIPELESMLATIEEYLPMGPEEWEFVADSHSLEFPAMNREASSLRRKFQALYNLQVPTGDPTCPPHVWQAKRLRYKIEERADSSNMLGGDAGADLGFDDNEEEDEEEDEAEEHDDGSSRGGGGVDEPTRQQGAGAAVDEEEGCGNNNHHEEEENNAGAGVRQQLNFDQEALPNSSDRSRRRTPAAAWCCGKASCQDNNPWYY